MSPTVAIACAIAFVAPASAFTPSHQPLALRRAAAAHARLPQAPLLSSTSLEAAAPPPPPTGTGVAPSIVNLAKNIVGSGVLALAAGVAAFSGSPLALVPSMLILLAVGAASAYTFSSIARVGAGVGSDTYRGTWAKVFGERTAILPDATVIFMTACAGLGYSIIIGDSFSSIAQLAGAPAALSSSNAWIVLLSLFVLLPLSLLRDLSSLAVGSVIGTAGTLYTALFIFKRFLDKSYAPGGAFHGIIAAGLQPSFYAPTAAKPLLNPGVFVLLSMLASAFLAHYNAPKFYNELEGPADGSSKLPRFNLVCAGAFGLAAVLMGSIMAGGFLTFGAASNGLILNNYATSDALAFIARLGIGMSIIFSYPINFVGLREGLFAALGKQKEAEKPLVHWLTTITLMLLMNGTALFVKNLGLVVGLGGAILGSALVYIFPAMMAIAEKSGAIPSKAEKLANWGLAGLGIFFAGLGAVMCLK